MNNTITSERLLAATPEAVFRAFTDPTHLARFWGPNGFTNTFHVFEPRAGGSWRFTMHGPDGTDYLNDVTFVEVTPHTRIVFIHHEPVHRFVMTMTFTAEHDATRLRWQMEFDTVEEVMTMQPYITVANEQNFDRLQAVLAG